MARIDKVKIGGIVFSIVRVHDLRHPDDNHKLDGHIIYSKARIDVDDSLSPNAEVQVIWHEVIHGVLVQAGHFETADKEDIVEAVSYGIMSVLYDNPLMAEVKL